MIRATIKKAPHGAISRGWVRLTNERSYQPDAKRRLVTSRCIHRIKSPRLCVVQPEIQLATVAACAPAEALAAPIASNGFPRALRSISPFLEPSCLRSTALAISAMGSRPATAAISAQSSGDAFLWPWRQLLMVWNGTPRSLARFASVPAMDRALSIKRFNSARESMTAPIWLECN